MPGSVAHDNHGVNLKNLRQATAKPYNTMGGFRPPHDWQKESHEHMKYATISRNASGALRDHSKNVQTTLEMRAKSSNNNTQEALKSKLSKVEGLKDLLHVTLEQTDDELAQLRVVQKGLDKAYNQKNRLLELNTKRLNVRAQRPDRELVADDVQSKLNGQAKLLQGSIDKINRCIANANSDVSRLLEARERLQQDMNDKLSALEVDEKALNLKTADTAGEGTLQKKVVTYPHNWYKSTEAQVNDARTRQNDSSRLRVAVERMLEDISASEKAMDAALQESLKEKTMLTSSYKGDLERQAEAVRLELGEANKRKLSLEQAIAAKKEPLALARQRYQLRKSRPNRELVHDEVEDALTQEFRDLQVIVQNLEQKLSQVNKEIVQLEANQRRLAANINDKDQAYQLDAQVLSMQAAASVAGSNASGAAAAMQSKIDSMERDLAEVRRSRVTMQAKLDTLKHTMDSNGEVM